MDNRKIEDRVKGAIFGQAIGDALGHPIEFQKTHQVVGLENDNKFTDDTQMFCAIGEAMLEASPDKGIEEFMQALSKHFIEWRKNPLGGSHRAPGGTCMEGVRKLGTGKHWRQTGATKMGKGNGSAMRAGIVGARYWREPYSAFRIGALTSVPTHNNLESSLAAGMVSYLVASSILGVEWSDSIATGLEFCTKFEHNVEYPRDVLFTNSRDGQSPWLAISRFSQGYIYGLNDCDPNDFVRKNGNDFTAVPAVSEAIYFNSRHNNFEEMTLECANISDDSDTITGIAGTIAGARLGFEAIPLDWKQRIEQRDYLHRLSENIYQASIWTDGDEKEIETSVDGVLDIVDATDEVLDLLEDGDFEVEF